VHLLFDLDGTLVDSLPAISASVSRTLDELGVRAPSPEQLSRHVGAPLAQVFAAVLGESGAHLIEPAIQRYRVIFDDVGMQHIALFPGIAPVLAAFHDVGHTMQVVTARSSPSAHLILRTLGLMDYFDAVHAPDFGVRAYDKADYVKAALSRCVTAASETAMVGDRADDVRAGLRNGIGAVGVSWGNGSMDELVEAGAHFVATDVDALAAWVANTVAQPPACGRFLSRSDDV
jgi:phosphoglycolate phosphatase